MSENDLSYYDLIKLNKSSGCGVHNNPCSPRSCPPSHCPCCHAGPAGPRGPIGPTGPRGAAGVTILDSYDTYQELIDAHPTGTTGDAYLVGGVLYVWDATTRTWVSMGSLIGPTGPTGAAGATILGYYETYQELIGAHPTGTAGDAYLVAGELFVWDAVTGAWISMGSLIGPIGPTGAAGATILDSYDTYQELIDAHPTGTTGDAYLVAGELYVWDAVTGTWVDMGSLIGPTGPTGAAGTTILDSYETYQELIDAHPTGTTGDAYLAGGVLYVWDGLAGTWVSMGSLVGPTGPTGPTGAAGATILDSYDTYQELIDAHPAGTTGDAYLVAGELFVWDGVTGTWVSMGSLVGPAGPTGPTGAAGATILDSYDTYQEFIDAHPAGTTGDAYLVAGELFVWDGEAEAWVSMGSLIGPTGATGATGAVGTILGSYDTLIELTDEHPEGNQGDAYLVDGVLYVWDTDTQSWTPVGNLRGPAAESRTIIPFASNIAPLTHSTNGAPTRVSLIGFGYGDDTANLTSIDDYSIPLDTSDGHFDLDEDDTKANHQLVFSLPFNMKIKSIALTCGTWAQREFLTTVYPYIQLYAAAPTSNSFRVIAEAAAIPEDGIGPGIMPRGTMRFALKENIDIEFNAGTRIAIGALMRTVPVPPDTTGDEAYWLYFTGSIGLAYTDD